MARRSKKPNNKPQTSRSGRSNGCSKPRESEYIDKDPERRYSSNDPRWYATDPAILRDAASIPFSWAVGTPIHLNNPVTDNIPRTGGYFTVPGICALWLKPSVGYSNDASSAINVAANATYSFVRHANSGHSNYDAPDLMIYLTCMSQVYAYIVYLQRIYGCAMLYSQKNRYCGKALLEAMFADFDDVVMHLADFRYGINVLINKAASFAVPNNMPYFNRQAFLYQDVYQEGSSIKDQLYLYVPHEFYKFALHNNGSGMAAAQAFAGSVRTVDELLKWGNDMISPLVASEDMNIMSGDILKAYGQNIIKLTPIAEDYYLLPKFDLAVLEQMKNATVVDGTAGNTLSQTTGTGGFLVSTPFAQFYNEGDYTYLDRAYSQCLQVYAENKLLSTTSAEPTAELVMESSRLMCSAEHFVDSTDPSKPSKIRIRPASEICSHVEYIAFQFNKDTAQSTLEKYGASYVYLINPRNANTPDLLKLLNVMTSFKFHPAMHIISVADNNGVPAYEDAYFNFDVDNYAVLTEQDIYRMHEAALMNMLHVPSIARV